MIQLAMEPILEPSAHWDFLELLSKKLKVARHGNLAEGVSAPPNRDSQECIEGPWPVLVASRFEEVEWFLV